MSDDTPTERFRPDGSPERREPEREADGGVERDDTPTELFRPDPAPAGADDTPTRLFDQQPGSDDPVARDAVVAGHVPVYDGRGAEGYPPQNGYVPAAAAAASAPPPAATEGGRPPGSSRGPMIALIVLGTLLVVGLVVLALVFATRGAEPVADASPSVTPSEASPTPSATEEATPSPTEDPTPEPTPTPTPTEEPTPAASFVSFSPADGSAVTCPDEETDVPLVFSWSSNDAERAWIGVGTTDARAEQTDEVDPSGTYRDLAFDCSRDSQVYTVSLENAEGELTSESVTLVRELDE